MPPSERSEEPDDDDGDFFEGIVLDDTEIEYEAGEEPRWTIEGYLKKKGQRSILGKKPWSKKYFSIDSQDGKFNCAEKHGAAPLGCLDVSEITSIMLLSSGKARFDVITGKVKEHELEAGSAEEAREWQQFLTLCVAKRDSDMFASEEKAASGQLRDGLMGPTNLNVLCGFMKKRYAKLNNSGNVWATRYWKLIDKNRKVLAYFDKQGGRVLGLIPLEFVTAVSRNQKNNRRFVIIMKSNPPRMYDLMAPSIQEANEWIQRITKSQCESTPSSLRKDGSNIWKDVPCAAPRAEKEKQVSQLRASDLSGPQLEQVVKKMTEGANFKRHELREGVPQSTSGNLQLDLGSQTLQWTGGRTSPVVRVNLLTITDLVVGCREKAFGEPKPSVDCCFSIACKKEGVSLNLEAKSVEQAEMWLSGVHSLIKRSGKTSAEVNHSEDSLSNIVTIMQQGGHFFRYEENPQEKSVNKHKIFLFYELAEKGLGTLYWGSPIARCKTYAMPLSEIKQIMLGKATNPLAAKVAKSADPNRCCAIVGSTITLSLEAESRGKRGLWLNGIHRILASVKKVDRNVAPTVSPEGVPQAPLQLTSSVMGRFKKYDLNAAGTASTCEEVVVWFSPTVGRLGSLFWGKVDAPLEENSDRSLALHTLSDGFLGKRDQAYLVPAGSEADVNCCFTLFSRTSNRTLNLEAPDSGTRQLWLSAIHAHLTPQTPKRPPDQVASASGSSSAASGRSSTNGSTSGSAGASQPTQPPPPPPSPDVAAAVAFMTKGRLFVMYDDKGRSEMFVYYRPSSKQVLGYLCWKESATAPENPNNMFPLRQLREIIGGKQSTPLQSPEAASADPSCCFHLKGTKMELSLQADSKQTRHEWFSALHKLMSASGKSKADGKAPEGAAPAAKVSKKADQAHASQSEEVKMPLSKSERMRMFSPTTEDPENVFKLIAKIGQGSYGSVFKGIDKRDGSEVALKMLEYEPESMRDIQNEVDILKNCASPFIVALKGVFIKGKSIWIAMEYCAAGSLADMMQICHKTLTEKQIAVALRMSLLGLEYLHGQGIIHRDVKAANVLVTEAGDCKLADFGVSSEIQRTLSRKQTVIGTPNWMAPEVISESEYNQSADLWSLGIVAIELAVGEPPLSDLHPMTAMFKIPSNPPPQLPGPQDKWSSDFRSFVRALLQKDPKQRPSCTQILQHPFVRNARNNAVIKELVDECMVEMRSFRDLDNTAGSAQGNTISYA